MEMSFIKAFITLLICLPLLGYSLINVKNQFLNMKDKDRDKQLAIILFINYLMLGALAFVFVFNLLMENI